MPFSVPSFFRTFGRFGSVVVARGEDIVSNHWYEQARAIRWLQATVNQAQTEVTFWGTGSWFAVPEETSTSFVLAFQSFIELQPGRVSVRPWARYEAGGVRFEFVPVFGTPGITVTWDSAVRVLAVGIGEDSGNVTLTAGGRYRVDIYLKADAAPNICKLYAARAKELQMTSAQL